MNRRRAQSSAKWVLGAAVLIAAIVGGVFLALRLTSPLVTVTDAVEGPVVQAFYSTGTVQPEREFPIKSNGAGILTEVKVDKGDHVKVGQSLAVVSDPELTFTARKAQAELEEKQQRADPKTSPVIQEYDARIQAMQALLEISQREEARIRSLLEKNAAAQTDLDTATDRLKTVWSQSESLKAQRAAKLLELQRELEVAKSALDTARWNLDQQTLKSPIDGVVLDRPLSVGTRVAINDRVMNVANIASDKLVMRAAVDEEDIIKVKPDQHVKMTLYSYADRVFEGRVQKIYDQADPERRTFEVDVKLAEPDNRLSPGMTGELAFEMASKDKAVVIPSQAVQKGGDVFVVQDGHLKKATAQIGLRGIERSEVISGINAGEKVLISAAADMKDGQRVRTSYLDPATAAGLNKPKIAQDAFKGFKQ
jgi:HlyD family secretion protein